MKTRILASLLTSFLMYVFVSFVKWDILWILEIPNYKTEDRFIMLVLYLMIQVFPQLLVTDLEFRKK